MVDRWPGCIDQLIAASSGRTSSRDHSGHSATATTTPRGHQSPHRCPNALSSGKSESERGEALGAALGAAFGATLGAAFGAAFGAAPVAWRALSAAVARPASEGRGGVHVGGGPRDLSAAAAFSASFSAATGPALAVGGLSSTPPKASIPECGLTTGSFGGVGGIGGIGGIGIGGMRTKRRVAARNRAATLN